MKRAELLKRIAKTAKEAGVEWAMLRQGGEHEVWSIGGERVTIPRHREVNELTAKGILKQVERAVQR